MKGFYSPIDRLMEQSTRPKGTGAEYMTELSKQPGFKQAEVEDRDLQTLQALPKMAREQFMAHLKAKPAVMPKTKVLHDHGDDPMESLSRDEQEVAREEDAAHKKYTLPGGTNYREILLQHPKGQFPGVEAHFNGQPNILASIRAKDRVGPNGEKILHLEEIQSDWHQRGREKGYQPKGVDLAKETAKAKQQHTILSQRLKEARDSSNAIDRNLAGNEPIYQNPEVRARQEAARIGHNNAIMDLMPQVMKAENAHFDALKTQHNAAPDAPFKKNWHELALKRMIHHAAEKGYDQIHITPGQAQADRYGLSKHVGMVSYNPEEQHFQAFKPNRETLISEKGASPERVSDLIGKVAANRLMTAPARFGHHYLEGEDLNIGGEGMKGFYDKMVPKFLNQFGKKYGSQVQSGSVPIISTPAEHHGLTENQFQAQPSEEQQRMVRQHAYAHQGAKTEVPTHRFDITPQMREDVLKNGMPLYAEGGEVEKLQDTARQGEAYQDQEKYLQTRDAMPDVKITSAYLPEGTNGMFSSTNLPVGSGTVKINKNTPKQALPSVLTHEMAHAADRQMMQQAIEQGMFGKGNQFTEGYEKLVGSEGRNRTELARRLNPEWESDNRLYRATPQEIAAHGIGAFSGPNLQDRAPKHVDATAATDFRILLDLAQRNADKGPKGLATIPAFFRKMGRYAEGGSIEGDVPRETVKAYKLFKVKPKHPGKLFPLFVNPNTPVDMNKWVDAEAGEISANGKVKSNIGDLAFRPGWHAGDLPVATHIGEKTEEQKAETQRIKDLRKMAEEKLGGDKRANSLAKKLHPFPEWVNTPSHRNPNHVWAEVEMPNDVDWQTEAIKRGYNDKGHFIANEAHITDQLPKGGHYRYKTNPNMAGNWMIGGGMKVNRVLKDAEVDAINKAAGAADLPRRKPFNPKEFGFAKGGVVSRETVKLSEGGQPDDEYRGTHTAPGPHFGAPLHDVSSGGMYPKDFYGPMGQRYYASEGWDFDKEAYNKVRNAKGKPDEMVYIHRAVPTHVYKEALKTDAPLKNLIRKGDWVALHKDYAKSHGESALGGDYKIASMRVPAKHVWTNADSIHEWGYHPESITNKAKGGVVSRETIKPVAHGIIKERVTVSPNMDAMRYELMSAKHFTKKVK